MELPPLSLSVHLPWCVRKCPYCDFNSHAVREEMPGDEYVQALLRDLEEELPLVWGRPVHSIFFGGGTPSLFNARQIETLLTGFRTLLQVSPEAEITLEANPGTIEHDSFSAYHEAGVNRVSLGVQSFDDGRLEEIGRIHGRAEVEQAVSAIHRSGISNFNIDLMFALPGQSPEGALQDVRAALACEPTHISHYQLTIEPNTAFHASPPVLPDEDSAWEMQEICGNKLSQEGFEQYEISAWSRPGFQCRHNLNYWRYGDFLGIGAGAHGKITLPSEQTARRRVRQRHPKSWMKDVWEGHGVIEDRALGPGERVFEFFLNQLRLRDGVLKSQLQPRTGVAWSEVSDRVQTAVDKGLLRDENGVLSPTALGWRFTNEIQSLFLP
ncbi:MAG: radical SAM family heme chaperone HemW [Xanthomonadales bacterium]|nr:radical SAM family heme chaperone HemW [Xanthomonadales bacterium]